MRTWYVASFSSLFVVVSVVIFSVWIKCGKCQTILHENNCCVMCLRACLFNSLRAHVTHVKWLSLPTLSVVFSLIFWNGKLQLAAVWDVQKKNFSIQWNRQTVRTAQNSRCRADFYLFVMQTIFVSFDPTMTNRMGKNFNLLNEIIDFCSNDDFFFTFCPLDQHVTELNEEKSYLRS